MEYKTWNIIPFPLWCQSDSPLRGGICLGTDPRVHRPVQRMDFLSVTPVFAWIALHVQHKAPLLSAQNISNPDTSFELQYFDSGNLLGSGC